jgi:hypothetical protein
MLIRLRSVPKTVGFFSTWAGRNVVQDATRELKALVEGAGHSFIPKTFTCYGKTVWVDNPDYPTQEDLAKAKAWGEYVITFCSK